MDELKPEDLRLLLPSNGSLESPRSSKALAVTTIEFGQTLNGKKIYYCALEKKSTGMRKKNV